MSLDDLNKIINKIDNTKPPIFSFDGNYLKKKGMQEGSVIGKTLKIIEREWLENNFKISEQRVLQIINDQDY